jgi:hypothetical protein
MADPQEAVWKACSTESQELLECKKGAARVGKNVYTCYPQASKLANCAAEYFCNFEYTQIMTVCNKQTESFNEEKCSVAQRQLKNCFKMYGLPM